MTSNAKTVVSELFSSIARGMRDDFQRDAELERAAHQYSTGNER